MPEETGGADLPDLPEGLPAGPDALAGAAAGAGAGAPGEVAAGADAGAPGEVAAGVGAGAPGEVAAAEPEVAAVPDEVHDGAGSDPARSFALPQSVWATSGGDGGGAPQRAASSGPASVWVPGPPRRPAVVVAVLAAVVAVAFVAGIGIGRSLPGAFAPSGVSGATGSSGPGPEAGPAGSSGPAPSAAAPEGGRSAGASAVGPPGEAQVASAAKKVVPSIVDLDSSLGYEGLEAAGTGIVIGAHGIVLTNNHVVDGETSLTAVDPLTGRHYRAMVVGYDVAADVAVVELSGRPGLPRAVVAPAEARVGEQVVAIGNAGGRGGIPSAGGGNVTGLGRSVVASDKAEGTTEDLSGLIETSARVQLGDSGGPLVDPAGQVVGMDTATSEGVGTGSPAEGFAIPIGAALAIARRIMAGDPSRAIHVGPTAFLGVRAASRCGAGSGLGSVARGSGALVCSVVPDTAAAATGLAPGDVIVSVSGRRVAGPTRLAELLAFAFHPGEVVSVTYRPRGTAGAARAARARLGSGPPA